MTTITLNDGSTQELPHVDALGATNCGCPGVWRFEGASPGPHVAITALIHGNEVCGAAALWDWMQRASRAPAFRSGRLTLAFCNLAAYAKLDDETKQACRKLDEDLNRVWGRVDASPAGMESSEMQRAREILPFIGDADVLLDIHSMSGEAPALGLVGRAAKNVDFARRLGVPSLLVQDSGHAAGFRLIDRHPFATPGESAVAMLIECGQHFSRAAFDVAAQAVDRTVAVFLGGAELAPVSAQSVIEVTQAVTIESEDFRFTQEWPNMGCIPKAGTLLAHDGELEVRTPYDDAFLIMPASARDRRPGLTAVRFGRVG
ncbi:succinylglutamate desuccinylase/aspartoacylase family protein [Caenimonas sp. SL110]|uniref:succinylglutamate desuccinylase/aspartoacylase domain-containing protein n=1 Tax=Caenimonas sp. SL110 TaxID=1450524 RepID=UPI00065442A8|nr:succinylglutamate desuccinylase/aspartoacylase family protein [Caenimonas sp. SL110]